MVRIVVPTGSEELLMRSVSIIPLYCGSYSYLQKLFVRSLERNPGNDTNWRPS
jgi:hypothetical protein